MTPDVESHLLWRNARHHLPFRVLAYRPHIVSGLRRVYGCSTNIRKYYALDWKSSAIWGELS